MSCVSVVVADRHPVILQGLSKLLGAEPDLRIVARCGDGPSCMEAIRILAPDIAVLDISMPYMSGPEVLEIAKSENLATQFVFFTACCEDEALIKLVLAGACSVVSRDVQPDDLVQTVRQIADGQPKLVPLSSDVAAPRTQNAAAERPLSLLTERERQIMRLVSEGLSNKEIARRLNICDGTTKVHLHHIFQKLEISNRTVLAALAVCDSDNGAAALPRPNMSPSR